MVHWLERHRKQWRKYSINILHSSNFLLLDVTVLWTITLKSKFVKKIIFRYPLDVVRRRMQLAGAVIDGHKYR